MRHRACTALGIGFHLLVVAGAARGSAEDREQLLPSEALQRADGAPVRTEPEPEAARAVADEALPQHPALVGAADAPDVLQGSGEVRAEPEPGARAVAHQEAARSPAPWVGADVPERRVGHKARAEAAVEPSGTLAPRRAKCEAPEEGAAPAALGALGQQEDEEPEPALAALAEAPPALAAAGDSPAAAPALSAASRAEPVLESLAQFSVVVDVATSRATSGTWAALISGPNATFCLYIVAGVVGALFLVASYCLWCSDRVPSLPERAEEFVADPLPRPRETRQVRATKRLSKQLHGVPRLSIDERRVSIDERAVVADEGS